MCTALIHTHARARRPTGATIIREAAALLEYTSTWDIADQGAEQVADIQRCKVMKRLWPSRYSNYFGRTGDPAGMLLWQQERRAIAIALADLVAEQDTQDKRCLVGAEQAMARTVINIKGITINDVVVPAAVFSQAESQFQKQDASAAPPNKESRGEEAFQLLEGQLSRAKTAFAVEEEAGFVSAAGPGLERKSSVKALSSIFN
jgi:hypothetical protein